MPAFHVVVLATLLLQAAPPEKNATPSPREKARELLDSAFDAAPGAQPEVAAMALMRVGENYEVLDRSKALEGLQRAFSAAAGIPPGEEPRRERAQSQIAATTAPVSLPDAVTMLKQIVPSVAGALLDEDPRQPAIDAVVARLLEKKQFDEAIDLMNSVGATGQYPFAAAGQIFDKLPRDDVRRPAIFAYALSAYTLRPAEAFGDFLVKRWKEIPKSTAEASVNQVTAHILSLKDGDLNETLSAEKGSVTLHGRQNVELFRILHVVRAIDPKRADEILDRRPELKAALDRFPKGPEDMGQLGNSARSDGGDTSAAGARGSEMGKAIAQLEALEKEMGDSETPESQRKGLLRSLEIVRALKAPAVRLELLSGIIAEAAAVDPGTAESVLSECMDLLKETKEPQLRAQAWAHIAEAAHAVKNDKLAREALDHAFDDAEELYKLDTDADEPNPAPRDEWPSTNAYRHIVISGVKVFGVGADTLLTRIADRDLAVFARVEIAQALLERPHESWMTSSRKTKN